MIQTQRGQLLNYTINATIEIMMRNYKVPYDWAIHTFLSSDTYKKIVEDKDLLGEGDLYIFELLDKELKSKNIIIS